MICPACRVQIDHAFSFESCGSIEIKGVGLQETFFVVGERLPPTATAAQ